jgi:hypothetical protein
MKRTLIYLAVLGAIASMSACGSLPREGHIPVPVPCVVELPAPPAWATDKLTPASTRFERVRALLAEREQARGYITELEAAAASCR